ncbi:response regulator [Sneathiella sp.]|uniref:response regulator n=1 Tax=Sneathiella sp. TaxID=1964365 RepID=UPI002FE41001
MADPRFRPATVLLFDPEPSMRQSIRSALLNIGFGAVIAAGDEADFVRKLEEESFDLVLAETASSKADTQHIIRDLRHSKVGQDPFVNVVLSIWNTGPEVVRDVINAGADDLILRPMSRAQIFARLRHLVNARKPFIVTADYIGPDRRASISKPSTAPTLIVPNSLRAKVEDMPELAATPEAIRLALNAVNERKIAIYSEQVMRLSSAVILLSEMSGSTSERKEVVTVMRTRNLALMEAVKGSRYEHILSLCEALDGLLIRLFVEKGPLSSKDQELVTQLPYAIHRGCQELHGSAGLVFDIRDVAARLRETGAALPPASQRRGSQSRSLTVA